MKNEKRVIRYMLDTKMKVNVPEQYPSQDITVLYEEGNLIGFQCEVETFGHANTETIKELAMLKLSPIMELISYKTGFPFIGKITDIDQVKPTGETATNIREFTSDAWVINNNLPKSEEIVRPSEKLAYQLTVFNKGNRASSNDEKIRNYYLVLEKEYGKNSPSINSDFRYTRHAVSHVELDRKNAEQFLQSKIGSNFIDFNNPKHRTFLKIIAAQLEKEVRKVIDAEI